MSDESVESVELKILTERFLKLQRATKRLHGDRFRQKPLDQSTLLRVQRELYVLAQAICARVAPDIQSRVDCMRREVMQKHVAPNIDHTLPPVPLAHTALMPGKIKGARIADWRLIDITPGVANNPVVAGTPIPRSLATKLRSAIIQQVRAIEQYLQAFLK